MRIQPKIKIILGIVTGIVLASLFIFSKAHSTVDYNTEVKPIFNKKCISCHGGVRRQSGFSLLFRSEALAKNESGKRAIIPGDPDHSEMIRRINLKDPEERMPYKHAPLSEKEISTLRSWIAQGAPWGDHWAYVPVKEVEVPKSKGSFFGLIPSKSSSWAKNDIDYFILDKLRDEELQPSPEASPATLLRRVSLDLTGLPAPSSLANKFLRTGGDKAYAELVDSLLASPRFGEKWASMWLDIARYADTKGYEKDGNRTIWRYRDWVIDAFNNDKPYNTFLTEQLAGDLLPNASDTNFISSAFHRNSMTNDEGGTDNEEFRTAAVIDRVSTTWQGLMGTTFACVQCHSHPYDPFTHEEYYKFMAFFNNTRDEDTGDDYPLLRQYDRDDSAKLSGIVQWIKTNSSLQRANEERLFLKTWQPSINSIQADEFINSELADTKYLTLRNNGSARLKQVNLDKKDRLIYRYTGYVPGGVWTIRLDKPDGPALKSVIVKQTKGWQITSVDFPEAAGVHDLYLSYSNPALKNTEKNGMQFDWFHFTSHLPGNDQPDYNDMVKSYWQLLEKNVPSTPVMMENPPDMHRRTYIFERGNWLTKGKEVVPGVPHALNPFPKNAPLNRLGLSMWLTSKENPLTARTMVNRLWEQLFGNGIVETLEDMGTQGAAPTHKELLDYLAYKFMNNYQWSAKKILREMVMSATYRQDSKVSKELLEKDPFNKWYARGARVRLSAEEVRDQALAVSGLLSQKMFGPPVMPWQPEGIWLSPYSASKWQKSEGEDQYRRTVYTFLKRTAPYPSMITFDGASREVCTARRIRTNTPLQALVILNDSVYLEAARYFAYRLEENAGNKKDVDQMIRNGYEMVTLNPITEPRLKVLKQLFETAYVRFKNNPDNTCEMIGLADRHNKPETAALVVVTSALLNLDEVITKN